MSHIFKLMRENVSEAPLEQSKDSVAIAEEMDRIKKEEAFFGKLLSAVAAVAKSSQASVEADQALWELFKAKGSDLKDLDFDHGAAICKAVQACSVIETQRQSRTDTAIQNMEAKLSKWSRDEVKSARVITDNYNKLHRSYSNSAHKVTQINRDKKVQLGELAVAEKKRDDLLQEWEREGRMGLQSLEHVFDKSRSTLMFALSEYIQSKMDMYTAAVNTLTKVQSHLGDLVHFATQQEALQRSSVVQLQSTIRREEKMQKEIDNAPRSLHPSLLAASAASDLFASRCPLNCSWDAKREGRSSKIAVGFDVRTSALTIGDSTWHVDDILALTKAHKSDSTKVRISFVNREFKDENLSFYSTKDREAFYEMFMLLRRGFANSFVATTQLPVTHEEIKVWTGSWNLGDAPPDFTCTAGMENWMPTNKFDLYVLALQESEYTPRAGYLTAEDDIFSFIRVHLGDNYLKLAGVSLTHIRLVCFVSRDHYHKISSVKTATVATGLAGVIGNKGCAAISFSFYDARFCFIGSHLAARIDRKRLEARNQNYRDILKGLASGFSTNGLSDVHHEFDFLFWLGDLNYRIDGLSRDEIIQKADAGDYKTLLKYDQLLNERALDNCFLECCEPDITFGPTYRFNRGDRTWSEEKMREPAYCDRVLYKTLPAAAVRPLAYEACHDLMTSDHSPISSTFAVAVDLPAMPHARDPMCKVAVGDMVGFDLKPVSGSNGGKFSVTLQAPWVSNQLQMAATITEGENPKWPGELELFPISTNRTYLANKWIRIVVKDGKVDVGVGIIYLEDALFQKGLIRWSANLADKGRYCGRLSGSLCVTFSNSYEDPWPLKPQRGTLPSYFDLEVSAGASFRHPSRSTLVDSDFKSKQSEHVVEGGTADDLTSSSSTNVTSEKSLNSSNGSIKDSTVSSPVISHAGGSPGPGSGALGAKSAGRSWASSRSPRNPPAYAPNAANPASTVSPAKTTPPLSTSGSALLASPNSNPSLGATLSVSPSGNKFITSTPSSQQQTNDLSIGSRPSISPSLLGSSAPATTSFLANYGAHSGPILSNSGPSPTSNSSSTQNSPHSPHQTSPSSTLQPESPRSSTSTGQLSPSSQSTSSNNHHSLPSTMTMPPMTYQSATFDAEAMLKAGSRLSAGFSPSQASNPSVGGSKSPLSSSNGETSSSSNSTPTATMADEIAELENLITSQQTPSSPSSISLTAVPSVVQSTRKSTVSPSSDADTFAKELAEFEELLNGKR